MSLFFPASDKMAKRELAEALRKHVAEKLYSLIFSTVRRNRKRLGYFPVNYYRVRGKTLDRVWFEWTTLRSPEFVIGFEQFYGADAVELFAREGWRGFPAIELPRIIGRVNYRITFSGRRIWFGLRARDLYCFQYFRKKALERVVECTIHVISALNHYLIDGAEPKHADICDYT